LVLAFIGTDAISCPPSLAFADEREVVKPSLVVKSVTAGLSGHASYEYIELYNPSTQSVFLDSWTLTHLRKEGSVTQSFTVHGTVAAGSSVLFAGSDSELTALPPDFLLKESSVVTTGGIVRLQDDKQMVVDELHWGDAGTTNTFSLSTGMALQRRFVDGHPLVTGDEKQDYQLIQALANTPGSGGYLPYSVPINNCSGIIISEIAANVPVERQFVELYNSSNASIALDGCLLQTNRSITKSYMLTGTLESGEYRAYYIAETELLLTKTTTGSVYLLASNGENETDAQSYDSLAEETSWAWYGTNDWRQTFLSTPSELNMWQEFLPCEIGYERAIDTGRCRKVVVDEGVISECEAGKYRSAETGKCRNLENSIAAPTPCESSQYRNPETNRCRSISPQTTELVACREGQERSAETNRCHSATSTSVIPASDFPVEPAKEAGKVFVGWWALGGVRVMGLAYAGWEWRREVSALIKRASSVFRFGK
jgi:hypothetical protein